MSHEPDPRLKQAEVSVLPLDSVDAEVAVLGSKSFTNRYIAIAALSGQDTLIEGALLSDDTGYFARGIEALGHVRAELDHAAASIHVTPTGQPMRAPADEVFMGGAGTPLRFLISMAGHAPGDTIITGNARMQERPMGDLLAALPALGVPAMSLRGNGSPPVRVTGGDFRGVKLHMLSPYQVNRITAYLHPNSPSVLKDSGFNAHQAQLAIGSGGLTGSGLFHGVQINSGAVYAAHTDFVFRDRGRISDSLVRR